MSDVSQGPGWWRASDNRWYPPHLHPAHQVPPAAVPLHTAARPTPRAQVEPYEPKRGRVWLIPLFLLVGALGLAIAGAVYAKSADKSSEAAASSGGAGAVPRQSCDLIPKADLDGIVGGDTRLRAITSDAQAVTAVVDDRALPDAKQVCYAELTGLPVRIAKSSGGATTFQAEKKRSQTTTKQAITVGNDKMSMDQTPYYGKDVRAGDEAFCTKTEAMGESGVVMRRGDDVITVSLNAKELTTSAADAPVAGLAGDENLNCQQAQKIAAKVR